MKVCRSTHPMDTSVYCLLDTHYYIVGSGARQFVRAQKKGFGSPTSPGHAPGSRMALYIFPDGCLRQGIEAEPVAPAVEPYRRELDRKSTRLNSSHLVISYAVFCLKKKNINTTV